MSGWPQCRNSCAAGGSVFHGVLTSLSQVNSWPFRDFLRGRRYESHMRRYRCCEEDADEPSNRNFSRNSRVFLDTRDLAMSRSSPIPFESLSLLLFLIVCLILSNVLQYQSVYIIVHCVDLEESIVQRTEETTLQKLVYCSLRKCN